MSCARSSPRSCSAPQPYTAPSPRQVVQAIAAGTERPIILPISNPTSRILAMPADVIAWSQGRALVAVGIPVPPVTYAGVTYQIGQANNALLFPGLGLGTIMAGASRVTPGMLRAAAQAVADQVDVATPGASLLPFQRAGRP